MRASSLSLRSLAPAVVSLGLVALLVSRIDVAGSWRTLTRLDGWLILLLLPITVAGLLTRAWRWTAIFPWPMRPRFGSCFRALMIGNLANNFLPGRGGDVLRCFLIAREQNSARASSALGTLGLEKVLDGLMVVAMLFLAFSIVRPPEWLIRLGLLAGIGFGASFIALLVVRHRWSWLVERVRGLFRTRRLRVLGEKVTSLSGGFAEGLNAMGSARQMVGLILLTAMVWVTEAGLVWGLALALRVPLSLPAAAVVSAILGLGLSVPAAPGAIGTYEAAAVAGLTLCGVGAEAALALAVLMHAWSFLTTTAMGLLALGGTGMRWSELMASRIAVGPARVGVPKPAGR